jgi:hypothetical protein
MVSLLASSAVNRGLEPRSGQPKDYICCFSAKHVALRRKSKESSEIKSENWNQFKSNFGHILLPSYACIQ